MDYGCNVQAHLGDFLCEGGVVGREGEVACQAAEEYGSFWLILGGFLDARGFCGVAGWITVFHGGVVRADNSKRVEGKCIMVFFRELMIEVMIRKYVW